MASYEPIETQALSVSSTMSVATFEGGIQSVKFSTTTDVLVDFDQPSDAGSFLVKANVNDNQIDFHGANVKKIYAQTTGGTGTLYILGIRN